MTRSCLLIVAFTLLAGLRRRGGGAAPAYPLQDRPDGPVPWLTRRACPFLIAGESPAGDDCEHLPGGSPRCSSPTGNRTAFNHRRVNLLWRQVYTGGRDDGSTVEWRCGRLRTALTSPSRAEAYFAAATHHPEPQSITRWSMLEPAETGEASSR